jgi:hypothetical protein
MTGDFVLGVFIGIVGSVFVYAALLVYEAHWGE